MKSFTLEERINMILTIGECYENCLLASRVYAQKYPDQEHPDKNVFERLLARFRETGSIEYTVRDISKPVTGNEEHNFNVLQYVIEDPNTSTRAIANTTGISQSSISRIIRKHKYHPYHIQLHQHLYGGDFERRLDFCLWYLERVGEEMNFYEHILFTDESTFHNNGLVNRHNFHYYDTENRHLFRTVDRQNRWSVNTFGGIIGDTIIGPYFFDGHLNGRKFLRFVNTDFWNLLENIPLNVRQNMWLQLDGAPAHYKRVVRNYLDRKFTDRWIGRGGLYNWPARSPDLTPLDFFLWGYIKDIAYSTPPTTPDDMKVRIRNAFQTVTPNMLKNVRRSFEKRIRCCIEVDGGHVEHVL